jgi:hypothetical protein
MSISSWFSSLTLIKASCSRKCSSIAIRTPKADVRVFP